MQSDTKNDTTAPTNNWKKIIIVISWLLVLIVCVAGLLFIIPKTNMYRFSENVLNRIEK